MINIDWDRFDRATKQVLPPGIYITVGKMGKSKRVGVSTALQEALNECRIQWGVDRTTKNLVFRVVTGEEEGYLVSRGGTSSTPLVRLGVASYTRVWFEYDEGMGIFVENKRKSIMKHIGRVIPKL